MHRYLLASTAALAIAAPAAAQDITTRVTNPVRTATIANGAAGNITITAAGSVVPGGGTAVTMDSNHAVSNAGAITIANSNNAVGILAQAGTSGDITNTGTITLDEPYTPTDTDNDGDLDGPLALGSNRIAIRTAGAHAGRISHTGTIVVEGNDSAGIRLEGPLTGALVHDGSTTVTGDRVVGLAAQAVTGNVRLAGTLTARGAGAVGAHFAGDVTGAMVVQGAITATGYRYNTTPAGATKLDADDLLQGGSALLVEGNVSGGIVLAVPPRDASPTNDDEDSDGIPDSREGSAQVVSLGAAPAMLIGATNRAIAIGPVAGTSSGYGLQIDGRIGADGIHSGVNGNGLVIGGRGGDVSIANGIGIAGSITANANDASATALRLGAGASTAVLQVSGTVEARGGNGSAAQTTAVAIDAGASLPTIRNSGVIRATAAGANGNATAIIDRSGTVTLLENSGGIAASGAAVNSGRNIAIDLSANNGGVTIRQTQVGAGFNAPVIAGDVRLGAGNDRVELADGSLAGTVQFGGGNNALALSGDAIHAGAANFGSGNDTLSLAGSAIFAGSADFGGGTDALTIADTARFSGSLANAANLSVRVTGGMLDVTRPATIASLDMAAGSTLGVTLSKVAGEGTGLTVTGAANFAKDARLQLRLADVGNAEGRYTVLQGGSLSGAGGLVTDTSLIPFLFKASIANDTAASQLAVDITRRSAIELGLNRSQTSAYPAVFTAIAGDDELEDVFLGITDGAQFRSTVRQMLPDHAGGTFESISQGTRALARQIADPQNPTWSVGGVDVILNMSGWSTEKSEGVTDGYTQDGLGYGAGAEVDTGFGAFGLGVNWIWSDYDNDAGSQTTGNTYGAAAWWRGAWGGFQAHLRGSIGRSNFESERAFAGQIGEEQIDREITGEWNGTVVAASGGLSYELGGGAFFVRPQVTVDYTRLKEDGYTETGGGSLNLIVDDRTSDELGVNGGVAAGIDFMGKGRGDETWFRVEGEGGWREIAGGTLGSTTARFGDDGERFTLTPEQMESGWYAGLRALGGGSTFELAGELRLEDRHDANAVALRGTLKVGF
ncbi:autotransporter outer membrane beta-barrel domain-containing protein [Croceibacterium ferulae]|uniref:autotransporter outer membrane beta-barrel domain-containing protein n=1 Tax=Croceibacterium ferulae TaxID=1854641 RepID=UPI000EB16459|nr:autotransporter outer membrane beta-barrel domain-containing protein [Croceibacterium ferulae]